VRVYIYANLNVAIAGRENHVFIKQGIVRNMSSPLN